MTSWIPVTERLPTCEDADRFDNVLWVWKDGLTTVDQFSVGGYVAWTLIPSFTPLKPEPTNEECERFWQTRAVQATERAARYDALKMWFANVTPAARCWPASTRR